MIDRQIIESAQLIRKNFLKLNSDLSKYQNDINNLISFLREKINELEKYNLEKVKKIRSNDDVKVVSEEIVKKIEEIETEEKKLQKKVSTISNELEKLKKDEEILYKTIRDRYPELSDDEIVEQIHSNLER
jgi:chromosome segregation ATPase